MFQQHFQPLLYEVIHDQRTYMLIDPQLRGELMLQLLMSLLPHLTHIIHCRFQLVHEFFLLGLQ